MLEVSRKKTIKYLRQHGFDDLVFFLQKTWSRHPEKSSDKHYQMWKEQVALNLPILFLASLYLHDFVQEHQIKNILFASRDCVHWHRIYSAMYPNEKTYFHSVIANLEVHNLFSNHC